MMSGLLWGTLEVFTAFVIACLPSTRLFVQHFFPVVKAKFTTAVSSHRTGGSAGTNVELQDVGRFGSAGDRRHKTKGSTTSAVKYPETDEIPLRAVEDGEGHNGHAV